MSHKCQAENRHTYGRCERYARAGSLYCWQHDPERAKVKAAEARREREEHYAALDSKLDRRDLERDAGLCDLTDADLRTIIELGGISAMLAQAKAGA